MSAPVGAFSVFPLAAAVTAPAGALPVFPHCRSSDCSPQERYLYFPTAAAVSAPAGALSIFPHCRSSARSSRSFFFSSRPLPSPSPNPPPLPFPTAPCHPGTPTSCFLHCFLHSSACSSRSLSVLPHCRSSVCSRRSSINISPLPQQCLPSPPPSSPHAATAAHFSRSRFFLQDAAASFQAVSSIPSALKPCNFGGVS